ncbi:hypothetical protein [Arcobacter sp.]|uniref:hypothetical protein n=1 Tax=Arcobacter sp. TaxID=1872629 RepID=UPI003D104ECB
MSLTAFLLSSIVFLALLLVLLLVYKNRLERGEIVGSYHKEEEKKSLNIRLIELPSAIESLNNNRLRENSKELFDVYKILDYKNDEKEYQNNSWHSWQVSFLVAMYKRDLELFLPDIEEVFHREIINESLENLEAEMKKFIKKYQAEVKIDKTKDALCKDLIWNAQEVATMMCYLSRYKNTTKDNA